MVLYRGVSDKINIKYIESSLKTVQGADHKSLSKLWVPSSVCENNYLDLMPKYYDGKNKTASLQNRDI